MSKIISFLSYSLLGSLIFFSTISGANASQNTAFDGAYVGAGVGVADLNLTDSTHEISGNIDDWKYNVGFDAAGVTVFGGYGKTLGYDNKFY